jgi:dCMP deaminase
MTVLLAYIPVIHAGYLQLFSEYFTKQAATDHTQKVLYLIPPALAQEFGPSHKDIHGLSSEIIKKCIETLGLFDQVEVLNPKIIASLATTETSLHIPDEVITRQFVKNYLSHCTVTTSSIFLRWDSENATKTFEPQAGKLPAEELAALRTNTPEQFMRVAQSEGARSSDWWRQVGAVAVRKAADGSTSIIAQAHNTHLPSEQQPYVEGDGRAQFHKGVEMDKTTAIHAEAKLIAEAAKAGVSLADADLYVTDFPCPTCAKLIATAGFKRIFYEKGYAVFDGERVLQAAGVEIVAVKDSTLLK